MNSRVDVRDALPAVRVPTLVLHRTGDTLFRVEESRYLADRIPGARLQLLPGDDHLVCGDPDQILDAIEAFLTSSPPARPEPGLALAAVAAAAGDEAGALVADLVAAGGRLRHDPPGRAVVLFDGPAGAVRAGLARLTPAVRMGLTIAELPRDADRLEGPGVAAAARLADAAEPGTLVVSATVGVLLSGSGTVLEPAGSDPVEGSHVLRVRSA
jgi:hypothetical protein